MSAQTHVGMNGALDPFEFVPVNVPVVGIGDKRKPPVTWLAPITLTRFSSLIVDGTFGLPIRICTALHRVGQDLVHGPVRRLPPVELC